MDAGQKMKQRLDQENGAVPRLANCFMCTRGDTLPSLGWSCSQSVYGTAQNSARASSTSGPNMGGGALSLNLQ